MQITGTIEGRDELTKKIHTLQDILLKNIIDSLDDIGDFGKLVMQAEAPNATGYLKESVKTHIDKGSRDAELRITPEADYAIFVEKGRGEGGMPPIENLRIWAQAKGFPDSHLFALAKAIAAGKTKANEPNAFVERTFKAVVEKADKEVSNMVEKSIRKVFS